MRASAPTTAQAARSEAERAERGAGQMRPCNPIPSAPAPRESTVKSLRHPAAPVGQSSQTRKHHLTPTPVQRGGTKVPERDKRRSFLLDRARPVFFSARPNMGPRRALRGGERRSKGAGAAFAAGGNGAERTLRRRQWGVLLPSHQHGCFLHPNGWSPSKPCLTSKTPAPRRPCPASRRSGRTAGPCPSGPPGAGEWPCR